MAAKKKAKVGRSPREIAKMWQKLEPQLAKKRVAREREGQTFTSITREEFEAKLKRVHLPMIVSQGWSPTAPPSGRIRRGPTCSFRYLAVAKPRSVCIDRQPQSDRQQRRYRFSTSARISTARASSLMWFSNR